MLKRCSSSPKKERKVMTEILKSLKERKKEETKLKFKENIQAENTKQIRCIPSTIPRTRFLLVVVVTLFFLSVCPFTLWEMSFSLALARRPICSSEDDDVADLRSSALIRSECEIVGPHRNWIWHLHEPLCTVRPDCCNRSVEVKLSPM